MLGWTGPGQMSEAQARLELTKDGFALGQVTREYSDTISAGNVTSQTPTQGSPEPKGTSVSFVISKGPAPVAVPNIVGMADTDAVAALQAQGFVAVPGGSKYDAKAPVGQVLTQSPAAGTEAPKGSQVTYTTSKGTQLNAVPDVTGSSKSQASTKLKSAGFEVAVTYDFSDSVDKGFVISQDPGSGGSYPPKTTVTITVSQGKGIQVPNCVGNTWAASKLLLDPLGLKISPSSDTSGNVVSQDPASGKLVIKGTTVHLNF